jgi:hypothetical protein
MAGLAGPILQIRSRFDHHRFGPEASAEAFGRRRRHLGFGGRTGAQTVIDVDGRHLQYGPAGKHEQRQ